MHRLRTAKPAKPDQLDLMRAAYDEARRLRGEGYGLSASFGCALQILAAVDV